MWLRSPVTATGMEDVFDVAHWCGVVQVDVLAEDLLRDISVVSLRVDMGSAAGHPTSSAVAGPCLLLNRPSSPDIHARC